MRCMFDTYNEHLSTYTCSDMLAYRGEFEIKTEIAFQPVRFKWKVRQVLLMTEHF
jgi:hypothetical protein